MPINPQLVEVALEYVEGSAFERFFQMFYPSVAGYGFIPLGGMHDGGADAYDSDVVSVRADRPTSFYQASIEADPAAKIRRTVRRLRDSGRDLRRLTYFTSRDVPNQDLVEEQLGEEFDITLAIRARKWIAANINRSPQTIAAFDAHLRPYTSFLGDIGGAHLIDRSPIAGSPSVCVFLAQEVERRRANSDLLASIVDSLILWSLAGTDPDTGKLMGRAEMLAKIEQALPTAKHFIRGTLDHRLAALASKQRTAGREVRFYRKDEKFCLPYEARQLIAEENTEDEALRISVLDTFRARASAFSARERLPISVDDLADLALATAQRVFEKEGLRFAAFFSDGEGEIGSNVADRADEVLRESNIGGDAALIVKSGIIAILRPAFYQSEESERVFFGKLSRTYALLFSLSADPAIIDYFRGMSGDFVLYVGADLIIQALSERYLLPEDQMATNTLKILKDAGATLILSEPALDEVKGHLVASDAEFSAYYMSVEQYVTMEHARHASKVLIRAYFYSKLAPMGNIRPPAGWKSYIGQLCSYGDLHRETGKQELKHYLLDRFRMEFASVDDLAHLTNEDEVAELSERLKSIKQENILALNDARQILAIYGKRRELGEGHRPNAFGYRTWWLTHESLVRRHTGDIVRKHGAQYILRPEFVLNFIALSPTTEEVRTAYRSIFPSALGLTLSNRMRDDVFKDVMRRVREASENDEARLRVMMGTLANRLKSDHFKVYEANFGRNILD
jgi:hypothetical protein